MKNQKIIESISIIIVNFKSWKPLLNCLQSIESCFEIIPNLEVIIVDNCSNDGELSTFKKKFSSFIFIENTGNNGFANACNLGAKNAQGSFLFFLNPDTIISIEPILKMYEFLKNNESCGIVSCLQKNEVSYEKSNRFFPEIKTLFGFFRAINYKSLVNKIPKKDDVIYPDWVSGAAVFMTRKWFEKVNGWNEDYWMYFEDVDLSKKITNLQGKIALLTSVEIFHSQGAASRLNLKTAKITKTEVIISKHVYVKNHFFGIKYVIFQCLIVLSNLLNYFVLCFFGILFFYIPKLKLSVFIFFNILSYYFFSLKHRTWLSRKSMNHVSKKV